MISLKIKKFIFIYINMAELNLNFEGINTTIQCDENVKLEEIIQKFLVKINKVGNNDLIYLYNGDRINKELKFKEQANEIDKTRMKMDILVIKIQDDSDGIKKLASNDIICPTCNENILIDIKDYKINLNDCKNNHKKENILPSKST